MYSGAKGAAQASVQAEQQPNRVAGMAKPLVSIITPVYNGERFLEECIQSVLAQTYPNFEYVIVNNCSGDRSLEIARGYAARDPRVRVHDNVDFLAAIPNWNHALRQASPEAKYIKVVHADDWLMPECVERMVAAAEQRPTVGLVGSYRISGVWVNNDGLPYPSYFLPGREMARFTLLGGPYVFGSPTSVLMRADLVRARDPFYQDLSNLTDMEVCYYLLRHSDFAFLHQVLTFTRSHEDTITSSVAFRGSEYPQMLWILREHGPHFLTREELAARWKHWLDLYYTFLGQNALLFREKSFWRHHREALARVELKLSRARIAAAAARYALAVLARPLVTIAKALRFSARVRFPKRIPTKPSPTPVAPQEATHSVQD